MKRPPTGIIVLLLTILLLSILLLFPFVHPWAWYPVIGFLFLSLIFYRKIRIREDKYDRILLVILLVVFLINRLLFNALDPVTLVIRTASLSAFAILNVVLLIGPWSRFSERIGEYYFYRRHLGVAVLLLGSLHAALVFSNYFKYSVRDTLTPIFTWYGVLALFILGWMGLTSWDAVQKKISGRMWKIFHALILLMYLGGTGWWYTIHRQDPTITYHLVLLGLFTLFWIAVAPYSIIRKLMRTYVLGWKQLHVLVYLVYLSLLIHAWLGFITIQNPAVKIIFWLSPVIVLGSHAMGWLMKWREDHAIYATITEINQQFEEEGKTFRGVDYIDRFQEGIGRKTYVNKQPVALFKQGETFFAISNTCAHQKGPLYQGKIAHGVVVCPWHYWKYRLSDGEDLWKEFCLPVYQTKTRRNILFVSTEPLNKEKVKYCQ